MSIERREIVDRQQWLEWRKADVTASDVAAVLGMDANKTPAKVWAEKTGLISPEPQTDFLEFRLALEAAVIDMLKFRRPSWSIRRASVYLRDPDLRLGATPDAVATDPEREGLGTVQCKTVLSSVFEREWKDLGDDLAEAPLNYQLQTLTEAMLCGASWAVIAALVLEGPGTGTFKLARIDRNPEAEQRIRDAVARFWATTNAGQMPSPLKYELDADVIAALYPEAQIKEPPLDLSADNRLPDLLTRRAELTKQINIAADEVDAINAEVKNKLGLHEQARLPGWRISWKLQKRPERIVAAWQGRVLRITESKGTTQ